MAKILAAVLALSVVGILMTASLRTSSSAAAFQERIFENQIPSHIPLKIKIKKEKEDSFKDLKNQKWLRGFELELTNTGDKPIYFVYITMGTNVKVDNGLEMVYPLTYGRAQLGDIVSKATSDDSPIKPGETIALQIREAPYWEKGVREGRWPQATKFTARIQVLSFGDGTGYFGTELYPPAGRPRAAAHDEKLPPPPRARLRPYETLIGKLGAPATLSRQPTFMSANFLPEESVIVAESSTTQPFVTCQFPECTPVTPWTGFVCYDNDPEKNSCRIQNRPTVDLIGGVCRELVHTTTECAAGNVLYLCLVINVFECGFGPGPTSSPSPTPTPETLSIL